MSRRWFIIKLKRGVVQGDLLSPIQFNSPRLCAGRILKEKGPNTIRQEPYWVYCIREHFGVVTRGMRYIGISFNAWKCSAAHIMKHKKNHKASYIVLKRIFMTKYPLNIRQIHTFLFLTIHSVATVITNQHHHAKRSRPSWKNQSFWYQRKNLSNHLQARKKILSYKSKRVLCSKVASCQWAATTTPPSWRRSTTTRSRRPTSKWKSIRSLTSTMKSAFSWDRRR